MPGKPVNQRGQSLWRARSSQDPCRSPPKGLSPLSGREQWCSGAVFLRSHAVARRKPSVGDRRVPVPDTTSTPARARNRRTGRGIDEISGRRDCSCCKKSSVLANFLGGSFRLVLGISPPQASQLGRKCRRRRFCRSQHYRLSPWCAAAGVPNTACRVSDLKKQLPIHCASHQTYCLPEIRQPAKNLWVRVTVRSRESVRNMRARCSWRSIGWTGSGTRDFQGAGTPTNSAARGEG